MMGTENSLPPNVVLTNGDPDSNNRYLRIIDTDGLFIILESTANPNSSRGIVCHTNITGGKVLYREESYGLQERTKFQ